jgi:hypothetical membrane protein
MAVAPTYEASRGNAPRSQRDAHQLRSGVRASVVAGCLLLAAGSAILLGIITAEALYDNVYTTHSNEVSDLGATRPPNSVILQPAATIFNTLMIVTGIAFIASALALHRAFGVRRVTVSVALLGIGVLGVGVFPGNREPFHPLFALLAFLAGGAAAVLSAKVQTAPFRYASIVAGVTTLAALGFGLFGESTLIYDELGVGGVERWIIYPVVLWAVAFGAYLTAGQHDASSTRYPQDSP